MTCPQLLLEKQQAVRAASALASGREMNPCHSCMVSFLPDQLSGCPLLCFLADHCHFAHRSASGRQSRIECPSSGHVLARLHTKRCGGTTATCSYLPLTGEVPHRIKCEAVSHWRSISYKVDVPQVHYFAKVRIAAARRPLLVFIPTLCKEFGLRNKHAQPRSAVVRRGKQGNTLLLARH